MSLKYSHQLGDGEQSGCIDVGNGKQVDYDVNGQPLVLADEFHVAEAFNFTVYRSRLAPG